MVIYDFCPKPLRAWPTWLTSLHLPASVSFSWPTQVMSITSAPCDCISSRSHQSQFSATKGIGQQNTRVASNVSVIPRYLSLAQLLFQVRLGVYDHQNLAHVTTYTVSTCLLLYPVQTNMKGTMLLTEESPRAIGWIRRG
jgi:hypothetical protein